VVIGWLSRPRPRSFDSDDFVQGTGFTEEYLRIAGLEQNFAVDFDFYVALALPYCFKVYFYAQTRSVGGLDQAFRVSGDAGWGG
jgi:hypothetical protein